MKTYGENSDSESNLYRTVDIGLDLTGHPGSAYHAGAMGWRMYTQTTNAPHPDIYFLQTMLLFCENVSDYGGFVCDADRVRSKSLYDDMVVLTAKRIKRSLTEPEQARWKKYVRSSNMVDLEFAHDVAYVKNNFDALFPAKKKSEKKKARTKAAAPAAVDPFVQWTNDNRLPFINQSTIDFYLVPIPAPVGGDEDDQSEIPPKEPYVGPQGLLEKVTMTVTAIPLDSDATVIGGLLVRFLIRDPSVNPGEFIGTLISTRQYTPKRNSPDPFSNYARFFKTVHPAGLYNSRDVYARCVLKFDPDAIRKEHSGNMQRFVLSVNPKADGIFHVFNVCNIGRAIETLRSSGCDTDVLDTNWTDFDAGAAFYPPADLARTWKYPQPSLFWYNPTEVGLWEQYFPHVDTSANFLRRLCAGDVFGAGGFQQRGNDETKYDRVDDLLRECMRISRTRLQDAQRRSDVKTNDEFFHMWFETKDIYERVMLHFPAHYSDTFDQVQELRKRYGPNWRRQLGELTEQVEECETYNELIAHTQKALLPRVVALLTPEGDIDERPISDAMKCILSWHRNNIKILPHMTREYVISDPALDFYGNTNVDHLRILTQFRQILQPAICMMIEGCFSVYDPGHTTLRFHLLVEGPAEGGKTHTACKTTQEYATCPGAVEWVSNSTPAADTTDRHVHDTIQAADETSRAFTNHEEGMRAQNEQRVSKEKEKLTNGQLITKVFELVQLPDGTTLRSDRKVLSIHNVSHIRTTNDASDDTALMSRFMTVSMKHSKVTPGHMNGKVSADFSKDGQTWLRINHFLSAVSKKCAVGGAILPFPEMTLFDEVSKTVREILVNWGCIGLDVGNRAIDIMRPYCAQQVYKMAFRCAFDCPWSPNYKKKFSVDQIQAIQPFLYVTLSQIWWTWTLMGARFINEDKSNVLRAMLAEAHVEWGNDETAYEKFENDTNNTIPFKTSVDPKWNKNNDHAMPGDNLLIDLNYLSISGTVSQVAMRVAKRTQPTMGVDQVEKIIRKLAGEMKKPEHRGYEKQPKGTFEKWHRKDGFGKKGMGADCPPAYIIANDNPSEIERSVLHMPSMNTDALPVIDLSDTKMVHFMPAAMNGFLQEVIAEALQMATMSASFVPGKMLLGKPHLDNPMHMTTVRYTQENIDEFVARIDESNGWIPDGFGGLKFHDENVPEALRPIPRRDGIMFSYGAAIDDEQARSLMTAPIAPKDDETEWQTKYADGIKQMSKTHEVVPDPDYHSAKLQHIRCGRPFDEPVRDPKWIRQQMIRYNVKVNDEDYPYRAIKMFDAQLARLKTVTDTQNSRVHLRASMQKARDAAMNPRNGAF